MPKSFPQPKKILMLLNLSRASGRIYLSSVMHEMRRHSEWNVRIVQVQEMSPDEILAVLTTGEFAGIISTEMEIPSIAGFLESDTRPLVVIGTRKSCIPRRRENVAFIHFSEENIGETCANYLMGLGKFKSFGFVHYSEAEYGHLSRLRHRGFTAALAAKGIPNSAFGDPYDAATDHDAMRKWLSSLAKPAALMIGCDKRAVEVLDACVHLKISVPTDLSVISVDNDECLCCSTTPTLSSYETNVDEFGPLTVRELARLIRQRKKDTERRDIIIKSKCRLFERESSSPLPPGMHLCRTAIQYIYANAMNCITVGDVVSHLHVSRRLADLRFREFQNESILQAITRIRLEEVARRLREDTISIGSIARICNFQSLCHLEKLFKRRFGKTMKDYRAASSG